MQTTLFFSDMLSVLTNEVKGTITRRGGVYVKKRISLSLTKGTCIISCGKASLQLDIDHLTPTKAFSEVIAPKLVQFVYWSFLFLPSQF